MLRGTSLGAGSATERGEEVGVPRPQLGAQHRLRKDTVRLGSGGARCVVCLDLDSSWVAGSSGCGVEPELGYVGALAQEQGQIEARERGEVLCGCLSQGVSLPLAVSIHPQTPPASPRGSSMLLLLSLQPIPGLELRPLLLH